VCGTIVALPSDREEDLMSELETKNEAEEFSDELSDEALDRAEGVIYICFSTGRPGNS
jgi:hypothetical protein